MDFLRSCDWQRARLQAGSDVETLVRWYITDPQAPVYPGWIFGTSPYWEGDHRAKLPETDSFTGPGILEERMLWAPNAFPCVGDMHPIGSAADFQFGLRALSPPGPPCCRITTGSVLSTGGGVGDSSSWPFAPVVPATVRGGGHLADLPVIPGRLFTITAGGHPADGCAPCQAYATQTAGGHPTDHTFAGVIITGPITGGGHIGPQEVPVFMLVPSPAPPTGLTAAVGSGQITLSWTAPAGYTVSGYRVYYATSATGPWTPWAGNPASGTTATVTGLTNGTPYWFTVESFWTNVGESYGCVPVTSTPSAFVLSATAQTASGGAASGSTASASWSTSTHAGNFLVMAVALRTNTGTPPTVTSRPAGWTQVLTTLLGQVRVNLYVQPAAAVRSGAENLVLSGSCDGCCVHLAEYTQVGSYTAPVATNVVTGSASFTSPALNLTATKGGQAMVSIITQSAAATLSAPTGGFVLETQQTQGTITSGYCDRVDLPAPGSYGTQVTSSSNAALYTVYAAIFG